VTTCEGTDHRPLILVVDDLADNRDLLSRRLGRRGYAVLEAASGPEALDIVSEHPVDLVLLDVMMPEMSGHEVLRRLREQKPAQELAVIMVTARDASSEVAAALDGGANDYLTKPIDFKILEARVSAQVRQMVATREQMRAARQGSGVMVDPEAADALTGLLTRRAFEGRVSRSLVNARQSGAVHTVVVMNIDDFRLVNAAYGQSAGDRVLQDIAAILRRFAETPDTVARLGGGEFGLLLHDCSAAQAPERLRELRQIVRQTRTMWRETPITTTVSMGVAEIGAQDSSVSEVLRAAALTCEAAKQLGKDQLRVYAAGDDSVSAIQRQADWAVKLQRALREDRLVLHAQPIVSARDRFEGPVSYEILVRMIDDGELISPFYFLPAAEAHGLMPELDRWVLERTVDLLTCGEGAADFEPRRICINLSGHSLASDRFLEVALDIIQRSAVDARRLCFEVTETAAIQRIDQAKEFMDRFQRLGVHFALDDFGSGVSSFGYLRELPVDLVKIDGRFVKNIESSPIDRAIVAAVNEIAHVLGKQTVAEFVESEDAVTELVSLPVDFLQGYHIGRPVPFERIVASARRLEQSRA
jgi:diguanylate cyclase (GGDEF)-like protein